MKRLVLETPGRLVRSDTGEPGPPPPGHALVQVHRIGVCGTDLHAFHGRQPFFTYPRVLGHELGVEILEVAPNDRGLVPGRRCAVEPYLNCGTCIACRRGRGNACAQLQVMGVHVDGGHRERLHVPIAKLHPSDHLTFDQLALVEPLAIGAHAVDRAALEPGESVLVIGTGPIGLAVIPFARAAGARVIAMDVNPARLAFCRDTMGVSDTLHATAEDPVARLLELTQGDLPTAVFDATGNPASMQAAFGFPAHGGRLVFVGLFQGDVTFHDPGFHRRELTLMGSRNARPADFTRILDLIASGAVRTDPWITHRAPFDEVPSCFAGWTDPAAGVIKAMIDVT